VSYRRLSASEAFWRPSNQMGIENTDLGSQLEAKQLGARLWRLKPGQASTRHRHAPAEAANTLEMSAEQLAALYPDGPKALPPELG
jgi:hypothetical protein